MSVSFIVYRDQFPLGSPMELGLVRAMTITLARVLAKRRWSKWPLLVCRKRSASSSAYRAFIAAKRGARTLGNAEVPRTNPNVRRP